KPRKSGPVTIATASRKEAGPFGYVHLQLGLDWKRIPAERRLPAEGKVGSALWLNGLRLPREAW
ncbi:hypothetical protein HispidOSU_011801, partial [Sigmodon hispidus]